MKRWLFFLIMLFFACSCGLRMEISPEKTQRAAMCKERCDKEHYNIKFIRSNGAVEYYKINIVSISEKTACECRF